MEAKLKHLEFIQNVITRMNSNSFSIKKWTITLITIIITVSSSTKDINKVLVLPYLLIMTFWVLDGYFLFQERLFRALYNDVGGDEFSMNIEAFKDKDEKSNFIIKFIKGYCKNNNSWSSSIFSTTLCIFYGMLMILTTIIFFIISA